MSREGRSHVHKKRRGCLSGCLLRVVLLLGVLAILFVGACVLGFVENDPQTGAPSLTLDGLGALDVSSLPDIDLSSLSLDHLSGMLEELPLDGWPYHVAPEGMTVKTLRTMEGEAVLVCCDGYTLLLGGGSSGALLCGQLLLCGAGSLSAVIAPDVSDAQAGGLGLAVTMTRPAYLLYPDSQTKGKGYNSMLSAAQKGGVQLIVPQQGLNFALGRAKVTVIGPAFRNHTDERDDGLSVRIDYGATSVLVMGNITQAGEREIRSSGAPLDADVLICAQGGSEEGTGTDFAAAVSPQAALLTGDSPANQVVVRLQRTGAQVYTAKEHGVMTVYSDGSSIRVVP